MPTGVPSALFHTFVLAKYTYRRAIARDDQICAAKAVGPEASHGLSHDMLNL